MLQCPVRKRRLLQRDMSVCSTLFVYEWFIIIFIICQAFKLELFGVVDSAIDSRIAVRCCVRKRCFSINLGVLEGVYRVEVDKKIGDCALLKPF